MIVDLSFELCKNDYKCSDRFYIKSMDSSRHHFEYMLNRFMIERNLWETMTIERIQNDIGMWMQVLYGASFCSENKIYVETIGCVCENGKKCNNDDDDDREYKKLLVVGITAVFVIWFTWNAYKSVKARNLSNKKNKKNKKNKNGEL